MSLGALSREAHETLAVALNRIGGKSNSGEVTVPLSTRRLAQKLGRLHTCPRIVVLRSTEWWAEADDTRGF